MNNKPGRMTLDELLNSDTIPSDSKLPSMLEKRTDGEIPFELEGVSRADLERFRFLVEQPTDEIALDEGLKVWAETFNGKVPSEWITKSRSMIEFFNEMGKLPQALYKYIPADWITAAILWSPPKVLLQELATKYPLRLVDVITLRSQNEIEFFWTNKADGIYKKHINPIKKEIKVLVPAHEFFKLSLRTFIELRFHFQSPAQFPVNVHELENFWNTLSSNQIYDLIDNPSSNEDFMYISQNYNTGPLNLEHDNLYKEFFTDPEVSNDTIQWAEYYNFPTEKTLGYYQLAELLTRTSLHNQKFDSELVDALITCPTLWHSLPFLSAFTKLSLAQNTTLFTRILCDIHPSNIQQAVMNQLLLGTSLENIDFALGLAIENQIKFAVKVSEENRKLNPVDFIELLEEIKAIENQKGFWENMKDGFKNFQKARKEKKLEKDDGSEEG